uniref:HECT domain-containing protein n=1 Tax=Seriola lalandi dorsalis TaxID=1841481 RepID=A0A3B4X599_SERLL
MYVAFNFLSQMKTIFVWFVQAHILCLFGKPLSCVAEGESSPLTLENVLEFTSGASTVPPLGFPHRPQIQFLHEANKIFPEANTCLIILHLPIHDDFDTFAIWSVTSKCRIELIN